MINDKWSLKDFRKKFGALKLAPMKNKETGDEFICPAFVSEKGDVTFCYFSKNLGELSPKQIKKQADDLQVVSTQTAAGKDIYVLCERGTLDTEDWEDVDF